MRDSSSRYDRLWKDEAKRVTYLDTNLQNGMVMVPFAVASCIISYAVLQADTAARSPKKKTLYCTPCGASLCSFAILLFRFSHRSSDVSTMPKDLFS